MFCPVVINQFVYKSMSNPLQLIRPHHLEDSLSTAQLFPPQEKNLCLWGRKEVRKDGRSGPDVEELGASERKRRRAGKVTALVHVCDVFIGPLHRELCECVMSSCGSRRAADF